MLRELHINKNFLGEVRKQVNTVTRSDIWLEVEAPIMQFDNFSVSLRSFLIFYIMKNMENISLDQFDPFW